RLNATNNPIARIANFCHGLKFLRTHQADSSLHVSRIQPTIGSWLIAVERRAMALAERNEAGNGGGVADGGLARCSPAAWASRVGAPADPPDAKEKLVGSAKLVPEWTSGLAATGCGPARRNAEVGPQEEIDGKSAIISPTEENRLAGS